MGVQVGVKYYGDNVKTELPVGKVFFTDVFPCCPADMPLLCLCYLCLWWAVPGGEAGLYLQEDYGTMVITNYIYLTGARVIVPLKYLVALFLQELRCYPFTFKANGLSVSLNIPVLLSGIRP